MTTLMDKIIRFKADNLWGFHSGRVIGIEQPDTVVVRTWDMETHKISYKDIIGFMNNEHVLVPIPDIQSL